MSNWKDRTSPPNHIRRRMTVFVTALLFMGVACTSVPVENPASICVPQGQCPDVQASAAFGEGDMAEGGRLFALHCASCHGETGKGAKPGVGDLTSGVWQAKSRSAQIAATIKNGRGEGMPAFALSPNSIANLVVFVRSLSATNEGPAPPSKSYP